MENFEYRTHVTADFLFLFPLAGARSFYTNTLVVSDRTMGGLPALLPTRAGRGFRSVIDSWLTG